MKIGEYKLTWNIPSPSKVEKEQSLWMFNSKLWGSYQSTVATICLVNHTLKSLKDLEHEFTVTTLLQEEATNKQTSSAN